MSKLTWGDSGNRLYTAGVDRGVLYPRHGDPEVWNGLTSVVEAPSDVNIQATYLDGKKIHRATDGSFAATINAFTFPDALEEYDGIGGLRDARTSRKEFNFSFRALIGNDTEGLDHGYKIHLIYNALATPTPRDYGTINDGTDISDFSWGISTRPEPIQGRKPSAHLVVNTALAVPQAVSELEALLYGTSTTKPRFPLPAEVFEIFQDNALFVVTDHGDGSWTITGPDSAFVFPDPTSFEITYGGAVWIDDESYTLSTF